MKGHVREIFALIHSNKGNGQPCWGNVCFDLTKQGNIMTSAPQAEVSRLNTCHLDLTRSHLQLMNHYGSPLQCMPVQVTVQVQE